MKKINFFIISIVVLILLACVSYSFATAKPSSAFYGIYSETYAGVSWASSSSGEEEISLNLWLDEDNKFTINSERRTDNPAEGTEYQRFQYRDTGWAGFGYTRVKEGIVDMSNYAGGKIKFSARSAYYSRVKYAKIGFQTKSGGDNWLGTLSGLGNNWKEFEFVIPKDKDLSDVTSLFVFVQDSGNFQNGNTIDIDNIRWEREEGTYEEIDVTGINFSAELQNGSGDKITWYTTGTDIGNVRGTGWKVANEHINLRITKFLDKNNNEYPIGNGKYVSSYPFSKASLSKWKFRIYTSSGTAKKDGLLPYEKNVYKSDSIPLPLCWRLTDSELTNFVIKETDDHAHLYEGNNDKWYCWLYIQNRGSDSYNDGDYAIMWNNNDGFRGSEGDFYGGPTGFDVSPKLYIGANFKNAAGGLEYKSIIVIECYNE